MSFKTTKVISILLFSYLISTVTTNSVIEFSHYTRRQASRLQDVRILLSTPVVSRAKCAQFCTQTKSCRSFNVNTKTGYCELNDRRLHDFGTNLIPHLDWDYYGEEQTGVSDGDWLLMFRGESGNGVKTTPVFLGYEANDPITIDPACFSARRNRTCGTHFLSNRVFTWAMNGIKKVRLNFYQNGVKVMENMFNGIDTSRENWFSKVNLQTSHWLDLALTSPAVFSLTGLANRKFYISTESNKYNCSTNYGWMAVIDTQQNYCPMDKISPTPAFVYSAGRNQTHFDTGMSQADVMAIFITTM